MPDDVRNEDELRESGPGAAETADSPAVLPEGEAAEASSVAVPAGEPSNELEAPGGAAPGGNAAMRPSAEEGAAADGAGDEEEEEEEEVEEVEEIDDDAEVEPLEWIPEAEPPPAEGQQKDWFILKVQSNRESSICDALRRRVAVAGMDSYFGEIIVPTEDVAEFKNGKKRIVKRKLYPGYILVNMVLTEETWFLVRETPGIGDFTGSAGRPSPMLPHEVERILRASRPQEHGTEVVKTAIPFKSGDRVRIKEGTFENFEGDVEGIDEANGRVTVMINIFGRSTPVELEHWQIESV